MNVMCADARVRVRNCWYDVKQGQMPAKAAE